MKKPEKRKIRISNRPDYEGIQYNQACDDWEKWLPTEEEIKKILSKGWWKLSKEVIEGQAKAIYKRIKGET